MGYAQHGWTYDRILAHYYTGTALSRLNAPRDVRVLRRLPERHARRSRARRAAAAAALSAREDLPRARRAPAGARAAQRRAARSLATVAAPLRVTAAAPLRVPGVGTYRGALEFRPGTFGGVNVINAIDVDDYVKGVVPARVARLVAARGAQGPGRRRAHLRAHDLQGRHGLGPLHRHALAGLRRRRRRAGLDQRGRGRDRRPARHLPGRAGRDLLLLHLGRPHGGRGEHVARRRAAAVAASRSRTSTTASRRATAGARSGWAARAPGAKLSGLVKGRFRGHQGRPARPLAAHRGRRHRRHGRAHARRRRDDPRAARPLRHLGVLHVDQDRHGAEPPEPAGPPTPGGPGHGRHLARRRHRGHPPGGRPARLGPARPPAARADHAPAPRRRTAGSHDRHGARRRRRPVRGGRGRPPAPTASAIAATRAPRCASASVPRSVHGTLGTPGRPLYFLHVPKTAGSAFTRMLDDAFPVGTRVPGEYFAASRADARVEDKYDSVSPRHRWGPIRMSRAERRAPSWPVCVKGRFRGHQGRPARPLAARSWPPTSSARAGARASTARRSARGSASSTAGPASRAITDGHGAVRRRSRPARRRPRRTRRRRDHAAAARSRPASARWPGCAAPCSPHSRGATVTLERRDGGRWVRDRHGARRRGRPLPRGRAARRAPTACATRGDAGPAVRIG